MDNGYDLFWMNMKWKNENEKIVLIIFLNLTFLTPIKVLNGKALEQ